MITNDILLTPEMMKVWAMTVTPGSGHVFVTGKAGSGKTTFLKYLKDMSAKSVVITAPTGVAAVNAGGVTLHSLFMIPLGPLTPETPLKPNFNRNKKDTIRNMDILIIDEVSMVRPDVLDKVDQRLRELRKNSRPFGGVQVIMFGDPFQLPPVVPDSEWSILKNHYSNPYFFGANVWKESGFQVVELKKIFRQTDSRFIDILNNLRVYKLTSQDMQDLGGLIASSKINSVPKDILEKTIHLCTHKQEANYINEEFMKNLVSSTGVKTTVYEGKIQDKFPTNSCPVPESIPLCPGARVMSLINLPDEDCYNGSLGTVLNCDKESVTVKLDSGREIDFNKYTWINSEYVVDKVTKKVISTPVGSYTQIPLIPAWAITIHKSQGLTFDNIYLHIKNVFSPGQLYVAMSRCRNLEGILTDVSIGPSMIIPNTELLEFVDYLKEHGDYYTKRL